MKLLSEIKKEYVFVPFDLNLRVETEEDAVLLMAFFNAGPIKGASDIFNYVKEKYPNFKGHNLWEKLGSVFHNALVAAKR